MHQVFLGVGWRLLKPLSIGVNASYLWGDISRTVQPSVSSASNTLTKTYSTTVNSYKLDFGVQWEQRIRRSDVLTIGAVFGLGHNLKNKAEMTVLGRNTLSNKNDTTVFGVKDANVLPMSYGAGLSYRLDGKLTMAADFSLEKWGDEKLPVFNTSSNTYELKRGLLKDRKKVNVGFDYVANPGSQARRYWEFVHYRIGAGIATPYYNINGQDGPSELSVSAGIGLPILNAHNNRSMLNISGQWARTKADGFITENTFRINIGITFNERWFMKWTVD